MDIKAAFKDFFQRLEVLLNPPDLNLTILGGVQVETDAFAVCGLKAGVTHVTSLAAIETLGDTQDGSQALDDLL